MFLINRGGLFMGVKVLICPLVTARRYGLLMVILAVFTFLEIDLLKKVPGRLSLDARQLL